MQSIQDPLILTLKIIVILELFISRIARIQTTQDRHFMPMRRAPRTTLTWFNGKLQK